VLRPGPHWGSLQHSPRPPSWFKGDLLLRGRGGKGEEEGRKGKERREEEGRGTGGRGRPPYRKFLDPPLKIHSFPRISNILRITFRYSASHISAGHAYVNRLYSK